jgi:hypothetical protein
MSRAAAAGINTFDLYDFFSVFVPGTALIIGLYPLFPAEFRLNAIVALLPVLVGGFIVGRALHSGAVRIEALVGATTHQDQLAQEIKSPDILTSEMVDRFYERCRHVFSGIGLPADRDNFDLNDDQLRSAVYTAVRSYVHIDSRGRSRTFQALYAFYRSMWSASIILAVAYLVYLVAVTLPYLGFPYTPKVATLKVQRDIFLLTPVVFIAGGYTTFRTAKANYRRIYTRYLIADFISVTE